MKIKHKIIVNIHINVICVKEGEKRHVPRKKKLKQNPRSASKSGVRVEREVV
jgi:hypothetical protein